MKKKLGILSILLAVSGWFVYAQQITRFAIVDMGKIYEALQKDTKAVHEWEERSAKIQQEVDKKAAEIQALKGRQAEAVLNANSGEEQRLAGEILRKTEALKVYFDIESKKLAEQRAKLAEGQDFLNKVYNELRLVAESEGYSMVLNLRDNKGIVWYSQAIDITDKIIANLKKKSV